MGKRYFLATEDGRPALPPIPATGHWTNLPNVLMTGAADDQECAQRPDTVRLGVESGFLTWVPVQAGKRCYLPTIHGVASNSIGYETLSESKAACDEAARLVYPESLRLAVEIESSSAHRATERPDGRPVGPRVLWGIQRYRDRPPVMNERPCDHTEWRQDVEDRSGTGIF